PSRTGPASPREPHTPVQPHSAAGCKPTHGPTCAFSPALAQQVEHAPLVPSGQRASKVWSSTGVISFSLQDRGRCQPPLRYHTAANGTFREQLGERVTARP
uniref:Uncharacterized protein n=1 Tax=Myotis lucifugus TaxID=59463 RepID=G1QBW7_MYOLU